MPTWRRTSLPTEPLPAPSGSEAAPWCREGSNRIKCGLPRRTRLRGGPFPSYSLAQDLAGMATARRTGRGRLGWPQAGGGEGTRREAREARSSGAQLGCVRVARWRLLSPSLCRAPSRSPPPSPLVR